MKAVMDPDSNAPTGIKLHFIDIYLDELAKVGAKEVRKYVVIFFLINVNCGMQHFRRNTIFRFCRFLSFTCIKATLNKREEATYYNSCIYFYS